MDIDLRNEIAENIGKQIKRMFDCVTEVRQGTPSLRLCKQAASDCIAAKSDLIDMLSKHPKWDEQNLRIHFNADYTRVKDSAYAKQNVWGITNLIIRSLKDDETFTRPVETPEGWTIPWDRPFLYENPLLTFARNVDYYDTVVEVFTSNDFVTDEGEALIKSFLPDARIHRGQKATKAFYKLLTQYKYEDRLKDLHTTEEYNPFNGETKVVDDLKRAFKFYTEYADAMNPLTVTRHTVLSVNPMDFLRMSYLRNGLTSCHYIGQDGEESGCYSAGCWSYAYDSQTMILYTVEADVADENITYANKYTRQVYFWNGTALMPSRLYPAQDNQRDPDVVTSREIVEQIIADCEGFGNLWKKTAYTSADGNFNTYGHHYPDYDYHCYPVFMPSAFVVDDEDEMKEMTHFEIGSDDPICVCCGDELDDHEYPVCSCCAEEETYYCDRCGAGYHDRDDGDWVDGQWICNGCLEDYYVWDELDHRYIDRDYSVYVNNLGDTHEDNAHIDNNIYYCTGCEEYYYGDNWTKVDGEYYCPDCADALLHVCSRCGSFHAEYDMEQDEDGNWVCKDCFEEGEFVCECCKRLHKADDLAEMHQDADIPELNWKYCKSCYDQYRHVCEDCGKVYYLHPQRGYIGTKDDTHIEDRVCQNCLSHEYYYDFNEKRYLKYKDSDDNSYPGSFICVLRGAGTTISHLGVQGAKDCLFALSTNYGDPLWEVYIPYDFPVDRGYVNDKVYGGYRFRLVNASCSQRGREIAKAYLQHFIDINTQKDSEEPAA